MFCHNCNTEMNIIDIKTLTKEQQNKILNILDKKNFFPKIFAFVVNNEGLKIDLLKKGYICYICPKDNFFVFKKKGGKLNVIS